MSNRKKNKIIKDERIIIRMTKEERQDLDHLSFTTGKSKSDILREGFNMYKNVSRNY